MSETGYATNLRSRRKKKTMLVQPKGKKGTIHIFRDKEPFCGMSVKPQKGPFDLTHEEILKGRVQKGWNLHLSVCGHCQKKYKKEYSSPRRVGMDLLKEVDGIGSAYIEIADNETLIEVEVTTKDTTKLEYLIGSISGVYGTIVKNNENAEDANVIIKMYSNKEIVGRLSINREMTEDWTDGNITDVEYTNYVLDTLE